MGRPWPSLRKLLAEIGGAAILPDNGVVNRLAGLAIPDDSGLALVGDANGRHIARAGASFLQSFKCDGDLRRNDVLGIVLDPAGLGKDLIELALGNGADGAALIKQKSSRAGCALIQC